MKKLYIFALLASLSLSAGAAVPFEKGKDRAPRTHMQKVHSTIPSRAAELQTLIEEDFSAFADGTETEPGDEIVYENIYHIPASYTSTPGWTGQGVRPAGGCVSLHPWEDSYGDTRGGYISTPPLMLDGTATLTFRAKVSTGDSGALWVVLCDDDYGPGDDELDAELTSEWQEFELVASNGSLQLPSYFQFSAEDGCIALVDDVKLVFKRDRIDRPYPLPAINVSPNEFIARWEEVYGAEGYLLNILCTTPPQEIVSDELAETFDGINLKDDGKSIDTENPGYPEGWTINVSEHGSQDVSTDENDLNSGKLSLKFDAVGDMITSPATPEPIDKFSFWCKPTAYTDDYSNMSLIRLELYHSHTDTWETIAQLGYYNFPETGGWYTVDNEQILGDDATRIRLSYIQKGTPDFFIDDIKLHYTRRGTTAPMLSDFKVEGTEYAVKDIDPRNQYVYFVKAYRDDVVSTASYSVWVDGITGLKVETEEPTDVTQTSFTASWKPLGHAQSYTVNAFRVVEPATDLENVTVLEETFDNITQGTVESPGTDWVSPFDFGAQGWASTSWCATQPAWAKGMAGTTGTNIWMGVAGLVYTPVLDLSCYDGKGITVDATFVTTVDAFEYNGQTENEGVFAIIMNSSNLTQPIASGLLDTPVVGSTSGTITISNVPEGADLSSVVIAFMNKSGLMFFVDYAKISMNVPAGKTLTTPLMSVTTPETSHKFEGLDPQSDHAFSVSASATRNYETFISELSDMRIVRTSSASVSEITDGNGTAVTVAGGAIIVNAPEDVTTEVYSTTGIHVAASNGSCTLNVAPGLYIVRAGNRTVKVAVGK